MSEQYREAGVDLEAGERAVALMREAVRRTFTPAVLADVGSFGGLFALDDLPPHPVLVASTDGVGTKVKLAAEAGRWRGIGHDIVNHCVNDILVQGARPLFFLDYVASSRLVPEQVAAVVTGVAEACERAGCALLGGETAEMPGVYHEGALDVAGTVVGLVTRETLLPRPDAMREGDSLVALPSSGPHTNGYSLIRRLVVGRPLDKPLAAGEPTLLDALLAPHRAYTGPLDQLAEAGIALKGIAHITGGGIVGNLPRILPETLAAEIDPERWERPLIFDRLLEWAGMEEREAFNVFNMGVGIILVMGEPEAERALDILPDAAVIGRLRVAGGERVTFTGMA